MRHTFNQRTARWALTLATVLVITSCDRKPKGSAPGTTSGTTSSAPAASGPTARQAADTFLAGLKEGKASTTHLTAAFKKQISSSSSEAEIIDWLAKFQGTTFVVGEESKFGNTIVLRGRAESPDVKNAFALRMVKEGESFKADWLHRSSRVGSGTNASTDPELLAAQDTIRNFLDLLLGGDLKQAHSLMTTSWKKSESPLPPGAKSKDGLEYDPGFLTQVTRSWKKDFAGYTLSKPELNAAKDGATLTAEMDSGTQMTVYIVKAKKVDGLWLVDSFNK